MFGQDCPDGLEPDCCGVCGGDNSQCSNCCGMPFPDDCSDACYEDYCGVCDDIPENDCMQDCAGVWGGDLAVDECGCCGGPGMPDAYCGCESVCGANDWLELDCAGECGGDLEMDCGGVCGGDNSTALSCCGLPFYDDCTTDCYEDSITGECCLISDLDECDACYGDGTSCMILGDINGDGEINIPDIVNIVEIVLLEGYDELGDMNGDGALNILDILLLLHLVLYEDSSSCTDIDGNVYETVQIGGQLWMAENLKVTHYNNGDEISTGYSNEGWIELETGAYAIYNNDPENIETYGNLYNWFSVDDDRDLCMEGWHVPSDQEINELEMYLGMSEEEANSMSYRGTNEGSKLAGNADLWNWIDELENNSEFGISGFNAIPAGFRQYNSGLYLVMGSRYYFWSSTNYNSTHAYFRNLDMLYSSVYRFTTVMSFGFSVRCLAD